MYDASNFSDVLARPVEAARQVEDVLSVGAELDFGRRFLPEDLSRTDRPAFPGDDEKRVPNPIRGRGYLTIFGPVEEFILRCTCPGSGMVHPEFTAAPAGLFPRIAAVAPAFS